MRTCPRWFVFACCVTVAAVVGCGDDETCGPDDAPAAGITVTAAADVVTYGGFTSSPNNDCPPPGGGPTSLTVDGTQSAPTPAGFHFTLCLPRPDRLGADPVAIGGNDAELVQVIDVSADLGDCVITLDRSSPPTGTAAFTGYCDDGTSSAGYALTLSATAPGTRTCNGTDEPVTLELAGTVAVTAL